MRTQSLLLLLIISSLSQASEIVGDWHGQISIMGTKLRISFHVQKDNDNYNSTMDSPDQGAFGIATTSTTFSNNNLHISMQNMGAEFKGVVKDGKVSGTFSQAGMDMPLVLSQNKIAKEEVKIRPQDPIKPYKYQSEDITFINKKADSIILAGTLTIPSNVKKPPVVIMISGSGPQNRDEEIAAFNHRPFLVWSHYLTNNGIAVLRFDDRGVGESQGSQENATSADFATDVEAAVKFLSTRSDIDTNKIGLIGHSEGGFIAPMVASRNKNIAFIVLLAGTGVDGAEILITQSRRAAELAGETELKLNFNEQLSKNVFDIIKTENDPLKLTSKLSKLFKDTKDNSPVELTKDLTDTVISQQIKMLSSHWFMYFIKTNPDDFLSKVSCPVLAINGEKDFQVLADLNLSGIKQSLEKANNTDFTIKELTGLNHLFQTAETGSLEEYGQIEETISPTALKLVADWINVRFNK